MMLTKRNRAGAVITYTYDNLNRLLTRYVPGSNIGVGGDATYRFTYDLAGRRLSASHGEITQYWEYDLLGRMTGQSTQQAGGPVAMASGYQYDVQTSQK